MQLMSETIEAILAYTPEHDPPRPTSFVVVVPAWSDERSHEMMKVARARTHTHTHTLHTHDTYTYIHAHTHTGVV